LSETPPRILIGITTHNRAGVLPKAIASALSQQNVNVVVAVHDDSSTDDTPTISKEYPAVEWTRSETLGGYRTIRNQWMQRHEFDYFVSLDDDAWFLNSTALETALARFDANSRLGAIAFDILSPQEPDENPITPPRETFMFIGCGHMLRLSAVAEAGYYVETPGPYGGEERDLAIRLVDLNYLIEFLGGVHVWHDKAWTGRDWFPLHRSGVCNDLALALQRYPREVLWYLLPGKILSYSYYWLRNPRLLKAGLFGLFDFLANGISIWQSRAPVRAATIRRIRSK